MRPLGNSCGRALALVAAGPLLLGVVACGDKGDSSQSAPDQADRDLLGPTQPASGEPVKIGLASDGQSQAFDARDEVRAAQATVDYWNELKGGIGGRPIELVACETGADPAG